MILKESLPAAWRSGDTGLVFSCLTGIATTAGARQRPARAARLLGAAAALGEASSPGLFGPEEWVDYDYFSAALKSQIEAVTFAAAWTEGQALTLDQAVAYALSDRD